MLDLHFLTDFLVLALEPLVAAQQIDGAILRGGHEPGAGVARDARLRPLLERGDQSIVRQILGQTDVAHDPRQTGNYRPSGYKVEENIEFKQQPVSLHLDAHIPPGKGPFPAVILVHDGGWTAGSKTANFVVPLFEPLTKTGYTWFTIDYRLAPQHPHPAAVEDVESAIVFVKKHAREYKVNPKNIALIGESAGGHLVNLVGGT